MLEYKSKPISSAVYQSTGNYTECPPFTKYMVVGVEKDSSDIALFADDFKIETNVNEPAVKRSPLCNLTGTRFLFGSRVLFIMKPYCCIQQTGSQQMEDCFTTLAKIVSIRSFDLKTVYK